ncbi:uncharacterized protein LOC127639932 [Xyrauchen texanus]|uniref:uncharacterized protein LOC127639932 n=1 Tax=Xyrauchen texanus TaxID=154827 RepID=UPI002241EE22|nr:uncharacterized protein LOC127639932 [Xyrauchen texanus]XP_051978235.1 uncharacterized protein LOC127639932 [Xyrauchen texanus]
MFLETKGPATPTRFQLRNGLHAQRDMGQHLPRPKGELLAYFGSGDHVCNTCGPKHANSSCSGCKHTSMQHLANQGVPGGLDVVGQSGKTELTRVQQYNSVSVNSISRECSLVVHQQQTEPHLCLRDCDLDLSTQLRGHGNCGVPVCVEGQQSGSVRGALLKKRHASVWMESYEDCIAADSSTFNYGHCTPNGQETLSRSLGHRSQDLIGPSLTREVMLSNKDANKLNINHQTKVAQGDLNGPGSGTLSTNKTQRAIQDQLQRVVVNLEEVLHDLKEIHLEMKEVVKQIDVLTADIEMGEDVPGDSLWRCHSSRVDTSEGELESSRHGINRKVFSHGVHSDKPPKGSVKRSLEGKKELCSSTKAHPSCTSTLPVAPPAYPIKDQWLYDAKQRLKSPQEMAASQRHESGTATGHRGRKPPPYSYASTVGRVNPKAKDKSQKTPPYPFRRRLLSTIV